MIRRALGVVFVYASFGPQFVGLRLLSLPEPVNLVFLPISLPTVGVGLAAQVIGAALYEWGSGD